MSNINDWSFIEMFLCVIGDAKLKFGSGMEYVMLN